MTEVRHLQHVEELSALNGLDRCRSSLTLSSSLRIVSVQLNDFRILTPSTFLAQLSVLLMHGLNGSVLQPDTLPPLLVTLMLRYMADALKSNVIRPIVAGVLPSQLQWLTITWNCSLADLALPPSPIRLNVIHLPDLPIPPASLPPSLHTFQLTTGCLSPPHLASALPSGLKVLRLHCLLMAPLTGELLSQVSQMEELDLGGYYQYQLTAGTLAPLTQLQVLRMSSIAVQPITAGVLLLSWWRLVVVADTREVVEEVVPKTMRHAGLVEFECSSNFYGCEQSVAEMSDENRRMAAQAGQQPDNGYQLQ